MLTLASMANERYKSDLTQNLVRDLFDYDPKTGFLLHKKTHRRIKAGMKAGKIDKNFGYVVVGINRQQYKAHRIIWLWMTGEWPNDQLDHENRIKHDNVWTNIRPAGPHLNNANRDQPHPSGGLKGTSRTKFGHYRSTIHRNGWRYHLGIFDTEKEAHAAYVKADKSLSCLL